LTATQQSSKVTSTHKPLASSKKHRKATDNYSRAE